MSNNRKYSPALKKTIKKYLKKGREVEESFASQILSDVVWATKLQDVREHWDGSGILPSEYGVEGRQKFDVKGMKKFIRFDSSTQDDLAWIESKNVQGMNGWILGEANYIIFERLDSWLMVNREDLLHFVNDKVKSLGYLKGKKPYHIYGRPSRQDKLTLVPFTDMEQLSNTKNISKEKSNEVHS